MLRSSQTGMIFTLILITSFCASCSGAKENSSTSNAPATASGSTSSSSAIKGGGPFEGVISAKLFLGDNRMNVQYATKGARMRVETPLSPGSAQTGVMLMDFSTGTQTMLLPQTKTYMNTNLGEMAGMMTSKNVEKDEFPKLTSTGRTETVAGLTCQHWLIGDKQDVDVCMAKGLGYFGGGGPTGGFLEKLKNLALGDKMKTQIESNPELKKFAEGGAFPLKMSQVENGQSKTIMEVTNVERKSLDDSLFNVPSDFKKMEIPGMMGKKP